MHSEHLALFVQVADHGSFSAAARHLNLPPKTVSKQIARLESLLGITLFTRSTRQLHITAEGRAMLEHARTAVNAIAQMREAASRQPLSGAIRLTAPAPFGRKYIAPAIAEFVRTYPHIGFDLRLSDQVADLYSGQFDLAIRIGKLPDSTLIARRLAGNHRILTASPEYVHRHGAPQTPAELAQHNCLVFVQPGARHDSLTLQNRQGQTTSIRFHGQWQSDSGEALHAWCAAGLGISLRETWDVCDALAEGKLVRILPDWQAVPGNISLVYPRQNTVPLRLRVFMDFLCERWENPPWEQA